jgi:hypothetical protein
MKLVVERFEDNGKVTLSNITLTDGKGILFTCAGMELPWKENNKQVSCIPKGTYNCNKRAKTVNIPYEHVLINNIPNRSGVCIHKANFVRQLKGCIAVGSKHVDIDSDTIKDVTESGKTFNVLMQLLPNDFDIEIK